MHDLDRIEQALASNDLDAGLFERCAQDLLSELYPGLSPVPGGTDFGRDADIHDGTASQPIRLMVTASREPSDIRMNMLRGLKSLNEHSIPVDRIVLANPGRLNGTQRKHLVDEARKQGVQLVEIHDEGFFASKLRRDGEWRERLLGLSGEAMTISHRPWSLADSPWSSLPLLGRDEVLETIRAAVSDVILAGQPGAGKTRLLAELPNVVFVSLDASESQLADDIRWARPDTIVFDDALSAPHLVRAIQRLRMQEGGPFNAKLVVVCWPDETDQAQHLLSSGEVVALELLERTVLDEIVRTMGVTGVLARQEILDQAEGRPGWAVVLTDLLLQSGWPDLLSGKALLGQSDAYFRRRELTSSARDVLALVATLGGIDETEIGDLAVTLGVPTAEVGRAMRAIAQGGLLDVEQRWRSDGGVTRWYSVRPPMLALSIATDHFFGSVPLGDIDQLLSRWADRRLEIAHSVCAAARLGSSSARRRAESLVGQLLQAGLSPAAEFALLRDYLLIDEEAADLVLARLRTPDGDARVRGAKAGVELAYVISARYRRPEGVRLLLDEALHDTRPTNSNPDHPLRRLEELCVGFHPDIPPDLDPRVLIADVLDQWMGDQPDEEHWRVWLAVVQSAVTPHMRGVHAAPEDPHKLTISETILTPEHADRVLRRVWPAIGERLASAPDRFIAGLVSVVHDWLRVGAGFDRPFGQEHPERARASADVVGRAMLADLVQCALGRPGVTARIAATASRFDMELPSEAKSLVTGNPFLRDIDRREDWRAAIEELKRDIGAELRAWGGVSPAEIVARLVSIRSEIEIAGLTWPDRVQIACEVLADTVDTPHDWVEMSLEQGLFPQAAPFIERLAREGGPTLTDLLDRCLRNPSARWATIGAVLAESADRDCVGACVSQLEPSDYNVLEVLLIRGELSVDLKRQILQTAPNGVRGFFAVALATAWTNSVDEQAEILWSDFLAAVTEVDLLALSSQRGVEGGLVHLLELLVEREPDLVELLFRQHLGPHAGTWLSGLGHEVWVPLERLPPANKSQLIAHASGPVDRWILLGRLMGSDVEWISVLLDHELATVDEVITAQSLTGRPSIEQMAELLVPKGVEAERVAGIALHGWRFGDESSHYQALSEQFAHFAESPDRVLSSVGVAGVKMIKGLRSDALARERQRRVRGEL